MSESMNKVQKKINFFTLRRPVKILNGSHEGLGRRKRGLTKGTYTKLKSFHRISYTVKHIKNSELSLKNSKKVQWTPRL